MLLQAATVWNCGKFISCVVVKGNVGVQCTLFLIKMFKLLGLNDFQEYKAKHMALPCPIEKS